VRNCLGDLTESKPSFLVGVPTIYDKIKAGITAKIAGSSDFVQFMFKMGFEQRKAALAAGKDTPLFNLLVFNKMKSAVGGNLRWMISGGAPLSKECGEFLRVCFGIPMIQGYALTETTAGGTIGDFEDLDSVTNVGPPLATVQMKVVDCPEMGYTHLDQTEGKLTPRGEIWIKGPNVSVGYYKNPEKTREEFVDGWFKTGDIGRINPNGTFSIIDRKKNLVKPPHGEYIAVERLEASYKNCPFVANIMVYACSTHNEVIALVFPNKITLEKWAATNGVPEDSFEALCKDPRANKAVLDSLAETMRVTNLKPMERISAVALYPDEWTPQNGWLTAALKIQRPAIHVAQKKSH